MIHNAIIKELNTTHIADIQKILLDVFTQEPWNDDWSDKQQLDKYIIDIIGNKNSLSLGLYLDNQLLGCSLGNIIHWYSGTEYYIREFFITRENQKKGFGSIFISEMNNYLKEKEIKAIILSTELDTPAFKFYQKNGFNELDKTRFFYKTIQ